MTKEILKEVLPDRRTRLISEVIFIDIVTDFFTAAMFHSVTSSTFPSTIYNFHEQVIKFESGKFLFSAFPPPNLAAFAFVLGLK